MTDLIQPNDSEIKGLIELITYNIQELEKDKTSLYKIRFAFHSDGSSLAHPWLANKIVFIVEKLNELCNILSNNTINLRGLYIECIIRSAQTICIILHDLETQRILETNKNEVPQNLECFYLTQKRSRDNYSNNFLSFIKDDLANAKHSLTLFRLLFPIDPTVYNDTEVVPENIQRIFATDIEVAKEIKNSIEKISTLFKKCLALTNPNDPQTQSPTSARSQSLRTGTGSFRKLSL